MKKYLTIFVIICLLLGGIYASYLFYCRDKKIPISPVHPKVSVIVPIYNSEAYLRRCLDSAIHQTLQEIEIICINDASTDNSLAILNEYARKDRRIQLVTLKKNGGVSNARNEGIKRAKGEFIGLLDSDDFIDPGWYENLYAQSNGFDFIRGVRLIDGWYLPNRPYLVVVPSIIRTEFIKEHHLLFENIPKEDVVFRTKLRVLGARTKEAEDNGQRYHYERRPGSLMNFQSKNIQKSIKKKKSKLNVVFISKNADMHKIKEAITSITKNNVSKSKYIFWILKQSVSEKNKKDIKDYVQEIGQEVVFIKLDDNYMKKWKQIQKYRLPSMIMAGITVPTLLPETVEKVLYLDENVLIEKDLKNLFHTNLKNDYIGIVQKNMIAETEDYHWDKALFDVTKMRQKNIPKTMLQSLNKYSGCMSRGQKEKSCASYKDFLSAIFKDKIVSFDF